MKLALLVMLEFVLLNHQVAIVANPLESVFLMRDVLVLFDIAPYKVLYFDSYSAQWGPGSAGVTPCSSLAPHFVTHTRGLH